VSPAAIFAASMALAFAAAVIVGLIDATARIILDLIGRLGP
jgi:hypothetical protein